MPRAIGIVRLLVVVRWAEQAECWLCEAVTDGNGPVKRTTLRQHAFAKETPGGGDWSNPRGAER
jgi:hypothetical protein